MPAFAELSANAANRTSSSDTMAGLSSAEAAARLQEYGKNEIPEEKESLLAMFLKQFVGSMPMMIEISALLAMMLGDWLDFFIILMLLLTNAVLGFIEEKNAQASVDALKSGLVKQIPVKRDGKFTPLDVTLIVPGDLLFLRGGNVVPADCSWLEGDELQVDQASLTGESLPVPVPREDGDTPGSGKKLFSGSILKQGEAHCVTLSTGLNTMMGEAAKSIQEASGHHTGVLEQKIIMAGRVLIIITLIAVAFLLFFQVVLRGHPLDEILEGALCLVIASVPVALPMVMKVTLSVGAKELADEGAIVTHLTALEEIASMKVLCSDKTGTLTTAKMTVYHETAATFCGFTGEQVLTMAALASNPANKDDAIDHAVFQAYTKMKRTTDMDAAIESLGKEYKTEKYVGFNPTVKRTVAEVRELATGKKLRIAKGIVSKILDTGGDGAELQWQVDDFENMSAMVNKADMEFGKAGYKTIAVAVSEADGPMRYAGTLPIMDPPRSDTAATIKAIRGDEVAVKMCTGDHLNIAKELARQIELGVNIRANTELWPASAARDKLILSADGFAQVMPKDKHEVVAVLQKEGMVVGMTGDGVNDAPALAVAQVGIAVDGATDAAQSAADIILTRPGLSPIYTAIQTSRRIFKRLKAYVIYRICVTVQVVAFLCIVSFIYGDTFEALYIILLALFHDLTIVTIAYDLQKPSPKPETPTVKMLIFVAYSMGCVLAASSTCLYAFGHLFLSERYGHFGTYKESCLFLQISNSSAFLIFNARTQGFFFMSKPAYQLFWSAIVSQIFVNSVLLFGNGFIVDELEHTDIFAIWIYDMSWLLIIDLVKMLILYITEGPHTSVTETVGRSRSKSLSTTGGTTTRRSGAPKLSKEIRVSLSGTPMPH